jgi:uncharacterized protein YidB (DUF937 family)
MGLLDGVASMLGGGESSPVSAILQMLNNHPGGLPGLVSQFQQGGLGEVMNSWVSNGQNAPVSADQLSGIFSGGQLSDLASQLGTDPSGAMSHLTQLLPGIIDQLSANGSLPQGNNWMSAAAGMLGGLMK